MNTRLTYLYRDASNYKQAESVVLAGEIDDAAAQSIRDHLESGDAFIPSQVGLPDLQTRWGDRGFSFPTEDDHVWHELVDLEPTAEAPTIELTAAALVERFAAVTGWDDIAAAERLGISA